MKLPKYDWEANKSLVTDVNGRKLTVGLFEELADPSTAAKPVFKLSDWHTTYVELSDPSEYKAAMALIGNWEHWQALLQCKPFMEHLERWREEVKAKLQSEAIANLREQARTAKGTAAAKWLAEAGFTEKVPGKRGPKKREQLEGSDAAAVRDDLRRLRAVK